jgi:hypothetical protein
MTRARFSEILGGFAFCATVPRRAHGKVAQNSLSELRKVGGFADAASCQRFRELWRVFLADRENFADYLVGVY